jgi:endonuclease/exonuclease/phosphatase family metal-dependent hydrolase
MLVQSRRSPRTLLALLALIIAAMLALGPAAAQAENKRNVSVLTRNLYLGTDLNPVLQAQTFPAFLAAVSSRYAMVQATDFPERAEALADEVADKNPDLIGLQEATLWRTDTPSDGPATPAENVTFDFLDILRGELAERGLDYDVKATSVNADIEAPSASGFDVRLTDRDVILARGDLPSSRLKVSNPQDANFATNFTLNHPVAGPVTFTRGWTSVDGKVRGKGFRFINTHLETQAVPPVQAAQANELLAGPADTSKPVLMLGDFNSAADGSDTPTYGNLVGAGFDDAWSAVHPGDPGYTCCQAEDLLNAASLLDQRIDIVFSRGPWSALDADIVGEEQADRTSPTGLWPSDHAGVVAELRLDLPR